MAEEISELEKEERMKLSEKQQIFTRNVAELICKATELGIGLTFGEAYRTADQQAIYVKEGLSQTMNSRHLSRLAVDFNFFINGELTYRKEDVQALGDYWEKLHPDNRWGGNWKSFVDTPHFEMKP